MILTIKKIKNILNDLVGKKIFVIYNGGRNKNEKYCGVVFKLYRNIFTIRLDNGVIKSFSYCDVLTKIVKICSYNL